MWLMVSCLMVLSLVLASCAPAAPAEEKPAPPTEEKPTPPKEEKPAPPVEEKEETAEKVLWRGVKADGTVVEKWLEKPSYGGMFVQGNPIPPTYWDDTFGHPALCPPLFLITETPLMADWTKGPTGTEETALRYTIFPAPHVLTGCLAESWEAPDADTLIYHIRKGVHWQNKPPMNGREMTAEDVAWSLTRSWKTATSYFKYGYPYVESITAPDKWTMVVKAPGMAGRVFEVISQQARISPREVIETYGDMNKWENVCGTGPFMLVDYVSGSSVTLTRNPNYWQHDPFRPENQLPYLDSVKILIIPDLSTNLAAMRTGKVDTITPLSSWEDASGLINTNPNLKYVEYTAAGVPIVYWRIDTSPFNDIRVRRALCMAVDNKAIVDDFYRGKADILTWPAGPIPEQMDIYTPLDKLPESVRELFEYHPDKAKQLLAGAGYPGGFKTEVVCYQPQVDLLSIVKAYFEGIGVDMEISVKEYGVYNSIGMQKTYKQMYIGSYQTTVPFRPANITAGNTYNFSLVNDPKINEAIDQMNFARFDESKRRQICREIAPYMLDQAYMLQLPAPKQYIFWQPWIKGYNGEYVVGYTHYIDYPTYVWLDLDMREKMTGRR